MKYTVGGHCRGTGSVSLSGKDFGVSAYDKSFLPKLHHIFRVGGHSILKQHDVRIHSILYKYKVAFLLEVVREQ